MLPPFLQKRSLYKVHHELCVCCVPAIYSAQVWSFPPPQTAGDQAYLGTWKRSCGVFVICASVLIIKLDIWNLAILGVTSELGANLKQHPTGSWHRLQCTKEIKAVQHVLISRGNSLLSRTSTGTLSPLFQDQEPFGAALEHHLYIIQPHTCGG